VSYKHLSEVERELIVRYWYNQKMSMSQIAKELDRDKSTVSRELGRNEWKADRTMYNSMAAQRYYKERISNAHRHELKIESDPKVYNYIYKKLELKWSPEQISGRMKRDNFHSTVSYECIYQFVYYHKNEWIDLLPQQRPKRIKRGNTYKSRKVHIYQRVNIHERGNIEGEYGHWEADSIISSGKSKRILNTLVEKKFGLTFISLVDTKESKKTKDVIISRLSTMPDEMLKTITYDNGTENVEHYKINMALNMKSYFCDPYSSYQKGAIENLNSLVRRYLPKKTNFDTITVEQIKAIENALNNRPRKRLGYLTPLEAYRESVALTA